MTSLGEALATFAVMVSRTSQSEIDNAPNFFCEVDVNSMLKNSTGCAIARMRCQNDDENRHFASRAPHLARVEKCHDGALSKTSR
jgi:hypothetical protein